MPILADFSLPASPASLPVPNEPNAKFFLTFVASDDPVTKQSWCPDVRAALPVIKATFSADGAPTTAFVEVGQRPEWKKPTHVVRTKWNVHGVPTVARYERVDGEIKETGRLVEHEILDSKLFAALVQGA
ncbi:related to Thioredoxin domain-containing protein C21C3.12c [Cephalotrichum gorgonifer]|uniref:Related to Thioredoxin domain-containing protein C21C3.12c n=1 Tax=Cephalotrichum gorgonifer TaxID=2041049 RepID=A0AAE8SSH4_9PEZI|nr:related to Thioredoxin domain-containing protein C21C3.12c [Cephalotrichum gorgonifer]